MIGLSKYKTYAWYVENDNGLSPMLTQYPDIPITGGQPIPFSQFFKDVFSTRYLCYPELERGAWTNEALGLLTVYLSDFSEKIANLQTIESKVLADTDTEAREIKSAPTGVLSESNYSLGGEVITRNNRPTYDDLMKYREMRPLISEMMRFFDSLFLPVVFGWDDQYPEVIL